MSQKRRPGGVSYDGVTRGMKSYNKYKDLTQKKARKIKMSDKCHGLTISSVKNVWFDNAPMLIVTSAGMLS